MWPTNIDAEELKVRPTGFVVSAGVERVPEPETPGPAAQHRQSNPPPRTADILAVNRLARALYSPVLADPRRPANPTRFVYLDPAAKDFFVDWERIANDGAAMLRLEAGRNPHDQALIELVGELSTKSEIFRQRWASHDVQFHRSGQKRLRHPVVGQLDLNFESMELPSDPGLVLIVYTAPAGSPTSDALKMLASWAATQEAAELSEQTGTTVD